MRDSLLKPFRCFVAAACCSMLLVACAETEEEGTSMPEEVSTTAEMARTVSLFALQPEARPLRDPFRLPPVRQARKAVEETAPLPLLSGIAVASGKAQAFFVLNGERITAAGGETIGGYLIVEIGNDRVHVKDKKTGKQFYLLPGN